MQIYDLEYVIYVQYLRKQWKNVYWWHIRKHYTGCKFL